VKSGDLQRKAAVSDMGEHWAEKGSHMSAATRLKSTWRGRVQVIEVLFVVSVVTKR